ncbi:MAG: ImmA/IrrE family metallo-endopeptidase [Novosphingobium aromaticivorans]|jgi:Zn-dependent peptidase ImmA (M78 family)|nr:ImmA/IrrE family metallo-endopeptidase [Novosphingobium aromaticivorans]
MTAVSLANLDKVFGADVAGDTAETRAKNSRREFVRGQTMLAEASPEATGHRMAAAEALHNYGFDILLSAVEKGQAVLVRERAEPARTLTRYREALGYEREHLARLAKVPVDDIIRAETPGKISSIWTLERLAIPLAIDERYLGVRDQPNGEDLGVRLRELANSQDHPFRLSPTAVAALAEGAWVIARQRSLEAQLKRGPFSVRERFQPDGNYGYPTYLTGYRLAAQTRDLLNLDPEEPIESMRALVSDTLDIPLVQTKMGAGLAGATIAHGAERGIVVNIDGANENVWVRRMTLAHELGHLLWDPAEQLNRLTVDRYSDLTVNSPERRDPVEVRANAFAIALLAPPAAVDRIVQNANDIPSAVYKVSRHFGISVSAAQAHVGNISRVRVVMPRPGLPTEASDEMRASEDFTVDYFPIGNVPPSVVGRFSWVVAAALTENLISRDTAARLLRTTPDKLDRQTLDYILALTGPR